MSRIAYFPLFLLGAVLVVAVIVPLAALAVVVALGTFFGSF